MLFCQNECPLCLCWLMSVFDKEGQVLQYSMTLPVLPLDPFGGSFLALSEQP